jgi:hypothetical protein
MKANPLRAPTAKVIEQTDGKHKNHKMSRRNDRAAYDRRESRVVDSTITVDWPLNATSGGDF